MKLILKIMFIKIYENNPNKKEISKIVDAIKNGKVVIIPTDSVYGIACDIFNQKAITKVARLKGMKPEKAMFSFIFNDIRQVSEYTRHISNDIFKIMKRNLPGPFTFILDANNKLPKMFRNKKKTLGVRIPDNNIVAEIVKELGHPILTTSVVDEDEVIEYTTDPSIIYDKYHNLVDIVIDGGYGKNAATTIIDCTKNSIEITRQGDIELKN